MFNFLLTGVGIVLIGSTTSDSERVLGGVLASVGLARVLNTQPWANK